MIHRLLDFCRGIPAGLAATDYVMPEAELELVEEPFEGPLEQLPKTRADVYRIFGDPGAGKVDRQWERHNMTVARNLPIPRGKLYCHRLAEPYLREALARCGRHVEAIERIGCFAFRHQRHDSRRPLSYHSWGIAVDLNPRQNRARKFGRGIRPQPFTEGWGEFWPDGLRREVVDAFRSVGWSWGGDWQTFVDPMHFELIDRS